MGMGRALPKMVSRPDAESRVPKLEICGKGNLKKLPPKGEDEDVKDVANAELGAEDAAEEEVEEGEREGSPLLGGELGGVVSAGDAGLGIGIGGDKGWVRSGDMMSGSTRFS
jgi:hypothetical protein